MYNIVKMSDVVTCIIVTQHPAFNVAWQLACVTKQGVVEKRFFLSFYARFIHGNFVPMQFQHIHEFPRRSNYATRSRVNYFQLTFLLFTFIICEYYHKENECMVTLRKIVSA